METHEICNDACGCNSFSPDEILTDAADPEAVGAVAGSNAL